MADKYDEWGYFSVGELQIIRNQWGLLIERDLHWKPGPVPLQDRLSSRRA